MPFVGINNKFNINFIKELYPMCSFGHLVGYDVAYYSYLWSVIYSYDILSKFEKYGLFNPKIGKELREKIMSRGGTVKGTELLKDFLGREPNEKYFMKKIFN
jgi:Zn-dependent oligopeptidase